MMRRAGVALLVLWLTAPLGRAEPAAIFLVRHAERMDSSADSLLSTAGHARAQALDAFLRDAGITAIFTTEYARTRATAAPLAQTLHLKPQVVPKTGARLLVERLAAEPASARVLVVGHADTLPGILKALGVRAPVTIPNNEYDDLFLVLPHTGSSSALIRLHY